MWTHLAYINKDCLQSSPKEPYSHLKFYVYHDYDIPWMFPWHMLIIPSNDIDLTQFQRVSPGATTCRLFHGLIAQSSRQIYCLSLELCKGQSSRDCRRPLKNAGNSHRLFKIHNTMQLAQKAWRLQTSPKHRNGGSNQSRQPIHRTALYPSVRQAAL